MGEHLEIKILEQIFAASCPMIFVPKQKSEPTFKRCKARVLRAECLLKKHLAIIN